MKINEICEPIKFSNEGLDSDWGIKKKKKQIHKIRVPMAKVSVKG
tara:strand:+ start:735 stop:869 length:135 start_codon:yes stop_codon:yes gene_type:complete